MDPITLLVISNPGGSHLRLLHQLQEPVNIMVGDDPAFLKSNAAEAEVILNGGPDGELLRTIFPLAPRLRWVHAVSAGVERVLFPELIESPVPLTNGRGVFKDALAEFAMAAILFFAKGLRRLVHSQEAGRWDQFDIEFVRGQTLGIVGYGEIGRESARLAEALGMKVVAVRRQTVQRLREILSVSDFVLVATPLTAETRGMIGEAELAAMKRSAVIINVGRGPVIVESALIAALSEKRIRGAALDVFDEEPLPGGHPFYHLDNVLLSPHSTDHTVAWPELAMQAFVDNFERFRNGQPLQNVVDKKAGY